MIFVLSPKGAPFAKFEASLKDGKALGQLRELLAPEAKTEDVQIYVPRFKVEASYALKEKFRNLGMRKAFEGNAFGGMLASRKSKKLIPLYIDEIYHKTFIDVNEELTEAAAATAMIVARTSARPSEPIVFRADRPFMYFLVENETGAILFMGRYVKP